MVESFRVFNIFKRKMGSLRYRLRKRWSRVRYLSRDEAHDYWRSPPTGENQPEYYVLGRNGLATKRSKYLVDLISSDLPKDASILEIGCNVGRNLNELHQAGFNNLSGIDISGHALDALRLTYPKLASIARLHEGTIEELTARFADGEFDVVFAMAVFQHIHYDSGFVFGEVARIAKNKLIVMGSETTKSERTFPRNYRHVFEDLGMKQVFESNQVPALDGICRVFTHRSPP